MRFFEILILLNLLYSLVFLFFLKQSRRLFILSSILLLIFFLCHLIFEGLRWQMQPAYLFSVILLLITVGRVFRSRNIDLGRISPVRRVMRVAGIFVTFLLLILASVPPIAMPVFKLPEPSGPLAVGSTTLFCRDTTRLDLISGEMNRYRELSVRVWYPAVPGNNSEKLPYMLAEEARYLAEHYDMPPFLLRHFSLVKTDSYRNATPMEGAFPIVFYSPSGDLMQNTALFQELASHGYIVFSTGHPYWNAFTYDSLGLAIPFDNDNAYYRAMWEEESLEAVSAAKEEITRAPTLDRKKEAQAKLNDLMPLEIADVRLWSEDLSFLLDLVEDPPQNLSLIMNHIDASRAGVIGFSKGGSAAGQFCVSDSRCRAGINLSGFMFGDAVITKISVPFMIMESTEPWCTDCRPICEAIYEDVQKEAFMVRINGARHGNFSDWSLVGPLLKLSGMIGPINGHRFLDIQNHYVLSFFDRYLRGLESSRLNADKSNYPEVEFNSRNTGTPL